MVLTLVFSWAQRQCGRCAMGREAAGKRFEFFTFESDNELCLRLKEENINGYGSRKGKNSAQNSPCVASNPEEEGDREERKIRRTPWENQ